jgi:hypothetical protein
MTKRNLLNAKPSEIRIGDIITSLTDGGVRFTAKVKEVRNERRSSGSSIIEQYVDYQWVVIVRKDTLHDDVRYDDKYNCLSSRKYDIRILEEGPEPVMTKPTQFPDIKGTRLVNAWRRLFNIISKDK